MSAGETYEVSDEQLARLDNQFTYHAPHGNQAARYGALRAAGRTLALAILERCPPSFELEQALLRINEAVFWANAAIARHEPAPAPAASSTA